MPIFSPETPNADPAMNAKSRRYLILAFAVWRTPELRNPQYAGFLE